MESFTLRPDTVTHTELHLNIVAGLGNYHFGVVKGLLDRGCLPRIISGTSAGAVVAAMACTRTDEELKVVLNAETLAKQMDCFSDSWATVARRYWRTGVMFDYKVNAAGPNGVMRW